MLKIAVLRCVGGAPCDGDGRACRANAGHGNSSDGDDDRVCEVGHRWGPAKGWTGPEKALRPTDQGGDSFSRDNTSLKER
jgi:hypothetical protein